MTTADTEARVIADLEDLDRRVIAARVRWRSPTFAAWIAGLAEGEHLIPHGAREDAETLARLRPGALLGALRAGREGTLTPQEAAAYEAGRRGRSERPDRSY